MKKIHNYKLINNIVEKERENKKKNKKKEIEN